MTEPAWQPTATIEAIARRAELYADIRAYFSAQDVLEVEVPVLGQYGVTDVHIDNLQGTVGGQKVYLQSSPEYFLKRLLAAYGRAVYSLGKAFREGESGARHHREFTMLEWYRPAWDEHQLMDEVADLMSAIGFESGTPSASDNLGSSDNPATEPQRLSYRDAFFTATGLDPHRAADAELRELAAQLGLSSGSDSRSTCLDFIFSFKVEPNLSMGLVFIYDYPAAQAALAKLSEDRDGNPIARRFEAFLNRMEVANGYWELCDADEQRQRFEADNQTRVALGKKPMAIDEAILAALSHGLPACAGVALGLDRVLMQLLGLSSISEVLSFSEPPD
ncbi:MAG: EF-P lysine aminoacylase GenX [Porticoccaceae bacterium]|nr:EF-P lysine aminoacylase GenX [Porticoccaceae bacterium]